jgi:hypothetical protein
MKKLLLTFTMVLAGLFAATAQVNTDQPAADGPQIKFNETTFDFGTLTHKVPATHEFVFTNTGNAPLVITNAKASCGCTQPIYPKEPIMPGKTGTVSVTFTAPVVTTFSKTITIDANAGQVLLTIKGNVIEAPAQPPVVNPNK